MWNIFHLDKLFSLNHDRIYYRTLSLPTMFPFQSVPCKLSSWRKRWCGSISKRRYNSQNFTIQIRYKLKFMTFASTKVDDRALKKTLLKKFRKNILFNAQVTNSTLSHSIKNTRTRFWCDDIYSFYYWWRRKWCFRDLCSHSLRSFNGIFMKRVKMFRRKKNITENINSAFMKLENFLFCYLLIIPVNGRLYAFKVKSRYVRKFKNSRHVFKSLFSLLWIITLERRLTSDRNQKGMRQRPENK